MSVADTSLPTEYERIEMSEQDVIAYEKRLKQALCTHEPNLDAKFYHPKGWRAPCVHCGAILDIQPRLQLDPKRKPSVHMSKKERIKRRKEPLFVVDKKEAPTTKDKVRVPAWMNKQTKEKSK